MFGFPTRFGIMPAQFKAFLDSTGQLWMQQSLAGKPCGLFFSTATAHGGQEVTVMSSLSFLAHHGILYVPMGGHPELGNLKDVQGGSPWGAGTIAGGDGSRQPNAAELSMAKFQGQRFATIASKLMK
ncbi:hypothetical protein HMI54_014519 [Coelomomyces lativittatus]|nr:hypothetical protein HMI56_004341 [Coelomomyces lativittatus]KAJ1514074.1 hypothetical protein HMI54_014519 [Coelomomyces lativittatus]